MEDQFSRVVTGNVRFSGNCEWLHVNVWFRDRSELQRLIDALIELRDSVGDQPDHVHLQHYDLAPTSKQIGLAEINFFRPARDMTDLEKELNETAVRELNRQVR
jgi:hypothetical protein